MDKNPVSIELSRGYVSLVDVEDYEYLSHWKWHASERHNVVRARRNDYSNGKHKIVYMHRVIMNAPNGFVCDHIDFNGLNNTKSNLSLCSIQDNSCHARKFRKSSSIYKGVSWNKCKRCWIAYITKNRKIYYLGQYSNEEEAAVAYNKAAVELFGEFAEPNQIGVCLK